MQPDNISTNFSGSAKLTAEKRENLVNTMVQAAKNGDLVMLEKLLPKGLLKLRDNKGNSALLIAVANGQFKTVQWLLSHGAKLSEKNKLGGSAMLLAALHGQLEILQWLLENGSDLSEKDFVGHTALMLAAFKDNLEIVQWLVRHKARLSEKSNHGDTAFLLAASNGHLVTAEWLLRHGAILSEKTDNGNTALLRAAFIGKLAAVQWLLSHGATLSEKSNHGDTAFLAAARNGQLFTIQWLLEHGATLAEKNNIGDTALLLAARNGHLSTVQWLLGHGAMLSERNNYGETALLQAACQGKLSMVQWLLENGAALTEKDTGGDGDTALLLAAYNGHLHTVQWLLKNGAMVSEENDHGMCALHYAAQQGHLNMVKWLVLQAHANIEVKNCQGDNAPLVAANHKQFHVVKWLFNKCSTQSKNALIENKKLSSSVRLTLTYEIILNSCKSKYFKKFKTIPKNQTLFETKTYFDLLPNELIKLTVTYLPAYELISLTKVNLFFHQCVNDNYVWKKIFIYELGNAPILKYINQRGLLEQPKGNAEEPNYFMLYFYCYYLKVLYEFIMDNSYKNHTYWKFFAADTYLTVNNFIKKDAGILITQAIEKDKQDVVTAILFFKSDLRDKVSQFLAQPDTKSKHQQHNAKGV